MIFQKSLAKKKGRAYAFFSGLVSGIVPALLQLLFIGGITFAVSLSDLMSRAENLGENEKLSDKIRYIIGLGESLYINENISLILCGAVIIGIIMAIKLFSFAADKKTVNVYYSLGIKRVTLFASRFFAGALLLCASTAIPILATYLVNVAYVGASVQLSIALFHFYVGFSLAALFAFALTLAMFSAVGTVFEGVLFSGVIALTPAVITTFAGIFTSIFLTNSTLSLYSNFYVDIYGTWITFSESISSVLTKMNPLAFFGADYTLYSVCSVSEDKPMLGDIAWTSPDFFSLFGWFFAFVAVSVLACFLFKRRKSENCGFLDSNKPLSNLTLSIVVFSCFLLGFYVNYYSYSEDFVTPCITGVIAAVVGYLVADFLLKRRFKPLFKGLVKLPVHLLVVALVIGGFYFSNDYYASFRPEKDEVESVKISAIVSPATLNSLQTVSVDQFTLNYVTVSESYHPVMLPEMTSEKDIDMVLSIHDKLIEESKSDKKLERSWVYLVYEMKNGTTKSRKYYIADEKTIDMLISCMNSDAVKTRTDSIFTEEKLPSGVQGLPQLTFEHASVTAVSPNLNEGYNLNLTEEQFSGLKAAIEKDLLSLTYEEYTSALNTQHGFLRFKTDSGYSYNNGDYHFYDEDVTIGYMEGFSQPYFPDAEIEEEYPEDDSLMVKTHGEISHIFCSWENCYDIIISDKMVNTLNFLKSIGCENCFENTLEIKAVSFIKFDYESFVDKNGYYWSTEDIYMREVIASCAYPDYEGGYKIVGENVITDKALVSAIVKNCCVYAPASEEGYICVIEYDNGVQIVNEMMFLPASLAPAQVTSYNYTTDSVTQIKAD